jgi:hypothetical protein
MDANPPASGQTGAGNYLDSVGDRLSDFRIFGFSAGESSGMLAE